MCSSNQVGMRSWLSRRAACTKRCSSARRSRRKRTPRPLLWAPPRPRPSRRRTVQNWRNSAVARMLQAVQRKAPRRQLIRRRRHAGRSCAASGRSSDLAPSTSFRLASWLLPAEGASRHSLRSSMAARSRSSSLSTRSTFASDLSSTLATLGCSPLGSSPPLPSASSCLPSSASA